LPKCLPELLRTILKMFHVKLVWGAPLSRNFSIVS
jgi:hypothetical protein